MLWAVVDELLERTSRVGNAVRCGRCRGRVHALRRPSGRTGHLRLPIQHPLLLLYRRNAAVCDYGSIRSAHVQLDVSVQVRALHSYRW